MDDELINLLRQNKVFSTLDEEACRRILPKFTRIELNHDETLFNYGDPADAIFLVASGKLSAAVSTRKIDKIVGHIDTGEIVGETGALTNEPRSLTVKAITDCVLYRLS